MQDELEQSPLREHIKQNAGKEQFHLTDEEWLQLAMLIDAADDQFTKRLRNLYDGITEYELHICYLVKLDIPSVNIGTMLYKSKAAIGMARQRMYKKLTKRAALPTSGTMTTTIPSGFSSKTAVLLNTSMPPRGRS